MTVNSNNESSDHHATLSQRLIRQANYEMTRKGDRLQASEKASGAVAHAVKALAEDRQWRHDSHNRRRNIVALVAAEFSRPDFVAMQDMSDQLHDNYYEDLMYDLEVQSRLDQITALLEPFTALRQIGPNPEFVPTTEQEMIIGRLRLTEAEIQEKDAIDYPPPMPEFNPEEE